MEGPRNVWLEALDYYRRGWSIIPIKPNDKKPPIKWGRYAVNRPSEAMIDKWFKGTVNGS